LNNTTITRCFTVYQLADIVVNQLPNVIQQYGAKMVVVSDLLEMFISNPQNEANESKNFINEIVNSITMVRALEDVLVVVSLSYEHGGAYCHNSNRTILSRFDKRIEIMNGKDKKNKMIDLKISNSNIKRIKNTTNDFHNGKLLSINKRDLLTVSAPRD
jgi:hypothetical protein